MPGMSMSLGMGLTRNPWPRVIAPRALANGWTFASAIKFVRQAYADFRSNYSRAKFAPVAAVSYYVDPVNGNDGRTGLSYPAAALLTPAAALTKAAALAAGVIAEIVINTTAASGNIVARNSRGWNNMQPNRTVIVRRVGANRFFSARTSSVTPPTWVADTGTTYKTTITAANSSSVIDCAVINAYGEPERLLLAASLAACRSTPGTYFHDGTDLYVTTSTGRNLVGDTSICPCTTGNNGRFSPTVTGATLYVEGIDFVGGTPFYAEITTASVRGSIVLADCGFFGANNGTNGLNIIGPFDVIVDSAKCAGNQRDGLNYHGNANGETSVYEHLCNVGLNGYDTALSNNASTAHEGAAVVSFGCTYRTSQNRVIHDINTAIRDMFGCTIGPSTATDVTSVSVATGDTASIYMYGSSIQPGSTYQVAPAANTGIYYTDMDVTGYVQDGTGVFAQFAA